MSWEVELYYKCRLLLHIGFLNAYRAEGTRQRDAGLLIIFRQTYHAWHEYIV